MMSKTKDIPAIEAGKPIKIEAETRQECADQIAELCKQADGMIRDGGFIEYERTAEGEDKFWAVIKFNKQ
jgi:hypothetical protein